MKTALDLVVAVGMDCLRAAPAESKVFIAVPEPLHGMLKREVFDGHFYIPEERIVGDAITLHPVKILPSYDDEFHAVAEHNGELMELQFHVDPVVRLLIESGVSWP